ncbi:HD domain-containing phosphohydrolase [Thiovibrio sp. JS02]
MAVNTEEISPEPGKILFVDDEVNILRALKRLFMDDAFAVFTASSGKEALRILESEKDIGVIVSDQRMPEMSGVEFLEQSRRLSPLSIRILLTGYADINAAVDAINRGGAFRYMNKPWNDEELVRTVQSALQNYFLIKENRRLNEIVKQQNEELKRWNTELEKMVQEQTMELQVRYDEERKFTERLRKNFKSSIMAFAGLLELRDKRMRSHSRNVAEIAANVGAKLGMGAEEREVLLVAALLHDIGKIGIPDIMLRLEASDMSIEEREEYIKHPVRGQAALASISDLDEAGVIIRHHHERFDGEGYPDKLKKKEIPLAARLIAIADFIDNRVRKYEGTAGIDLALRQALDEAGKRFDPRLVPGVCDAAKIFYRKNLPRTDHLELEIYPRDLAEGMVVSRDVFSGTGILLLGKGAALNRTNIEILKRYYELDPASHGVFISMKG